MPPTYAATMNRRGQRTRAALRIGIHRFGAVARLRAACGHGYHPPGQGRPLHVLPAYAGKEALLADSLEHPVHALSPVAGNATPAEQVALLEFSGRSAVSSRVFFEHAHPRTLGQGPRPDHRSAARAAWSTPARAGWGRRESLLSGRCRDASRADHAVADSPAPAKPERIAAMLAAYTEAALLQGERTLGQRR